MSALNIVKQFALGAVVVVAAGLSACGDDSGTDAVVGVRTLPAGARLQGCSTENFGELVYVEDSSSVFFCANGKWQPMNGSDTVTVSSTDTVVVSKLDTLLVSNVDTVLVTKSDTMYVTNVDTLYVSNTDTLYLEKTEVTGSGILDFNPESEIIPIMENLVHQKRGDGYKLQAQQVVLLHFTDIHGDGENLARIKEFKDAYSEYIDVGVHTGDNVYENWDDSFDYWFKADAGEFLNTLGNHDAYYKWGTSEHGMVPQNEAYVRIFAPFVTSWGVVQPDDAAAKSLMYYYKDVVKGSGTELTKVRLIILDEYHWDESQSSWLVATLEDARVNDFAVVICRHEGFDAVPLKNNPFSSLEHMGSSEKLADAQAAVDEFMKKGGEFVVWLGGHGHQDAVGRLQDYPKQIVFLGDLSSMNWTGWNDSWREVGTESQDCFTLIGIDRFEKVIRFVRIGADRDRYGRVKDAMSINYATAEAIYPAE